MNTRVESEIFLAILAERGRQRDLHPACESLPSGTGGGGRVTYMKIAQAACDRADREGRLTHAHVFEEEAMEVLAAETDEEAYAELVQVGAVVVKWATDILRRRAEKAAGR